MAKRIVTALFLIAFAVVNLIFYQTVLLPISVTAITFGIIYEIYKVIGLSGKKKLIIITFLYVMANVFSTYILEVQLNTQFYEIFNKMNLFLNFVLVLILFTIFIIYHKKITFVQVSSAIAVTGLITYSMNILQKIAYMEENVGAFYLVLTLCSAWLADTGAYFVGTFFGKHKLCPEISPKKTVEGLIGGVVTNALILVAISYVYFNFIFEGQTNFNYILIGIIGAFSALIGTAGDLTASLIKRNYGIKDFSNFLPGHGGITDRFDSVIFVAPFIYLVFQFIH